jgi:hypothetical protein
MELTKRSWPEIVAHIPRNLGSGETSSTKLSPSHLGFMRSHIRFDWLRFACVAVGSFFGSDTVMVRIAPEATRQDKARRIWKIKINREQNYRADEAFSYKLFVTIIHPGILRLHWWRLIWSC